MEVKVTNKNYCGTIVEIKNIITLDNCNNVCATIIMGNHIIVSKEIQIGDIGIFFPVECQLSDEYCRENNLYKDSTKNNDINEKGYFEENRRIRCIKFRGHKSEGLFMPLTSLKFTTSNINEFEIGQEFNDINKINICQKYIIKSKTQITSSNNKNNRKKPKESILIDNQFKFHQDTSQLYRNLFKICPLSIIHISYKVHGTSAISSNILVKKKLKWHEKVIKKLGIEIIDSEYKNIYSSRSVIKNNNSDLEFYGEDVWAIANNYLKSYLQKGMTLYYEIVGYLPSGAMIQKDYDYGCANPTLTGDEPYTYGVHYKIFIYRITYTNIDGKTFEFQANQVQEWCNINGLVPVIELYSGKVLDFMNQAENKLLLEGQKSFGEHFLDIIKKKYNEKDCFICSNIVPEEGCVIRIEGLNFEAFKCKSSRFYLKETASLDKGVIDLESEN